jgi:hypothetical protein
MRWLALAVLGGCSFTPGRIAGGDLQDAGAIDGALDMDTMQVTLDAPGDSSTDTGPGFVRSIDITDAKVTGGPHTSFPLLVSISASWLKSEANSGTITYDDGADIYFTADLQGTMPLAFDIEAYDEVSGDLAAWAKIPALSGTTVIYMHYGDPSVSTSRADRPSVWTNAYELVAHFDGSADATNKNPLGSATNLTFETGKIGSARGFDGDTSVAPMGSGSAIDDIFAGGGTIEAWFNAASFGELGFGRLFEKGEYALFLDDANTSSSLSFWYDTTEGNGYGQWHFGADTFATGEWHHVALEFNTDAIANVPTAYIDGVEVSAAEDDAAVGAYYSDALSDMYVGNDADSSRAFDGMLDEVRMSSATRSAGWLATQYRNQSNPGAFYTVSDPL